MSMIVIENPNAEAVDVRVLGKSGFLGLSKQDRRMHVGPQGTDSVEMPPGKYYIRYRYPKSAVFEGDAFALQTNAAAKITLVARSDGNYRIQPSGGDL